MRKIIIPKRGWIDIETRFLRPASWNYKIDDQELAHKLETNIRKNGFILNIVVREIGDGYYEVLDGNHRLIAIQNIGFKKVHAYNMGPISELQAKRLAIELNESRFIADEKKLFSIIQELLERESLEELEETLPFENELLEELSSMIEKESMIDSSLGNIKKSDSDMKISDLKIEDDPLTSKCKSVNCLTCETQELLSEFIKEYNLPMEPNIIIKQLWTLLQQKNKR